jgi:Glutathione S-transferase
MQNQNKYVLTYWNCRGRAQPLRFLLEYLGIPYEEKRYEIKDAMDWFAKDKHQLNHPFPNLPNLKDGERIVTETEAIYQYICKKANRKDLLGANEEEEIDVCTTRWFLHDLAYAIGEIAYNKDFETIKDAELEKKVAPKLAYISKFLGEKEFLHGHITYVDFLCYELLTIMEALKPEMLAKNLKDYIERFANQKFMKNYMASDKYIKRPFYGLATWNPME